MISETEFKHVRKAIQGKYFKYAVDDGTMRYMRIVKVSLYHMNSRFNYYCDVIKDGNEYKGGSGFFESLESFYDRIGSKRITPQEYKKALQRV